jgi:hypothetical protein
MWSFEELIGKTKLYFSRATALDDETAEESALWLLLGLEFLLRAPLANVHPVLLAVPEGDSILHAAGITQATAKPQSIPMKTVLNRLLKIDPNFGDDRAKDAAFLIDLRNGELHSSSAVLANISPETWTSKFLDVVEAVCRLLNLDVADLLDDEFVEQANVYRDTANKATKHRVTLLLRDAVSHFQKLTSDEKEIRRATPSPAGYMRVPTACPAAFQESI